MRRIKNVHLHEDPGKYNCFGCAPHNQLGLQLEFWEDGEEVLSHWKPQAHMMGWHNVLHGGIQATLMDEVSGWLVYVKCGTAGVTAEMQVKYRKPLLLSNGMVTIRCRLLEKNRRFANIEAKVYSNGEVSSEGILKFYLIPEEIARKDYHYPGAEAFFDEE
ncbi:MAG: PaaI family thioesterase [Prolixibacteraceae bacterium]|nr:PaaI family thioesterase [Prolixibacteraceae bacterium]